LAMEVHVRLVDAYESGEFQMLEERLIAKFSPPLRPEEVQRCLVETVAAFEDAPVRTYLSVLIERSATDRLRTAVRDAPGCAAIRQGDNPTD
jgi:hypothetical protein